MTAIRAIPTAFARARGAMSGMLRSAPAAAPAVRPVSTVMSGSGRAMTSAAPLPGSIPANAGHTPGLMRSMGNYARRAGDVATSPLTWMGNRPKLMGGVLGATFGGEMLAGLHNQYKANEMMDKNIQDHMSGVAQGGAGVLTALRDAPFLQRAAFLMAPQQALNSRTFYDQMHERLNSMGGSARAYAPGIMQQIWQHLQPGAKITAPTPSAGDLTMSHLQQEQQRLQQLRDNINQLVQRQMQGTQASAIQ